RVVHNNVAYIEVALDDGGAVELIGYANLYLRPALELLRQFFRIAFGLDSLLFLLLPLLDDLVGLLTHRFDIRFRDAPGAEGALHAIDGVEVAADGALSSEQIEQRQCGAVVRRL